MAFEHRSRLGWIWQQALNESVDGTVAWLDRFSCLWQEDDRLRYGPGYASLDECLAWCREVGAFRTYVDIADERFIAIGYDDSFPSVNAAKFRLTCRGMNSRYQRLPP